MQTNAKRLVTCLIAGISLLTVGAAPASAKLNPLRVIEEAQLRADVALILDTSGSMSSAFDSSGICADASGSDCLGERTTVDVCGDGMCSGIETGTSCAADCNLTNNETPTLAPSAVAPAGQAPTCANGHPSRLAVVKHTLRHILPEVRASANVSLIGFEQQGYYSYYPAVSTAPTKPVTVLLDGWQLRQLGAWDSSSNSPLATFVWPAGAATGELMTLLSASSLAVASDSLYRRADDPTIDKRFAWATAGRRYDDGLFNWVYGGSYYTYNQMAIDTASTPRYEPSYLGPQFSDGGTTWVYSRYANTTCHEDSEQGVDGTSDAGRVLVPLITSTSQADHDVSMAQVYGYLDNAPNGGLLAVGQTAIGAAIATARQQFADRAAGSGSFTQPDGAAACRTRLALVISDGTQTTGTDPVAAAASLRALDSSNPIRTYVIGLPGADMTLLDSIAQAGGTFTARYVNSERELRRLLYGVMVDGIGGTYATAAAGISTSAGSAVENNVAVLPTTGFPNWRGNLSAVDLTTACATSTDCVQGTCVNGRCQLWEAGELLQARSWKSRRLYTGLHDTGTGQPRNPIAMLSDDGLGTPCLTGGAASGCDPSVGINDVWTQVVGTAPPADLGPAVQWLAGRLRLWKLPGIVNTVPASVGPPPHYSSVVGHDTLESNQSTRRRIVYLGSNEGLLHAFDAQTGEELFAYLAPHLLPKAYDLYQQNGQDADPARFSWILDNSPRIEDLANASASPPGWGTYLVQTDGPGGKHFVVLDITSPGSCSDPLNPATCTLNDPPFQVVLDSAAAGPSIDSTFGATMSLPALFWTAGVAARAAMGSGYDLVAASGEGSYYHLFTQIPQPWSTAASDHATYQLDGAGSAVTDYAVVADTAATVDLDGNQSVLATYQADLNGRVTRFAEGTTTAPIPMLDATDQAGSQHPFYLSPAVLYSGDVGYTSIAANAGVFRESACDDASPPAICSVESRLYLRTEQGGVVNPSLPTFTCDVSQVCDAACYGGGSVASNCTAPSSRAQPADAPLLIRNTLYGDNVEAFYAVNDPPTAVCNGNTQAASNGWIIRVGTEANATELLQTLQVPEATIVGLSIAGGGGDIVITKSGRSGTRASIETLSGGKLVGSGIGGAPVVESWREVP